MNFLYNVFLFIHNNVKQLQRKWSSLPLLFLFPILIVGLSAYIVISFFIPEDDNKPILVGLIDQEQSEETTMIVELIEESSQLSSFIRMDIMTEKQAQLQIENNDLSAYITFPEDFTSNLYNGTPVTLEIIGNPNKRVESYLIKELVDSISRHIRTAQANILTINYYAKQLNMDDETRNDFLFKQFTNFVFYTLGKDKILDEETIANNVSASPVQYYGLGGLFIIVTLWLLTIYSMLTDDDNLNMKNRMRLYSVTETQQLFAKIIVCWTTTISFSVLGFLCYIKLFDIELFVSEYYKIAGLMILYCFIFLLGLAIIEVILSAPKVRLLIQSFYTGILLLLSGAIIPTIYFPIYLQDFLPFSFVNHTFNWLQEIILNHRVYIDYVPLLLYLCISALTFFGVSIWKERVTH